MDLQVSIIVPVYKVERYLEECVHSIQAQTYTSFELILVDDGSPDSCPQLCDTLADQDKRIKVVHKANGGLSDARNVGLEHAKGKYVIFIDGDDFWFNPNDLEALIREYDVTPDCDFIGFNCSYYYENSKEIKPWYSYDSEITQEKDKETLIYKLVETGTFPMSACLKIIKREFLIDNNIRFIRGLLSEDIPWYLDLLYYAKGFRMTNLYIYAYRQVSGDSITHSFSTKHFDDLLRIVRTEKERLGTVQLTKTTKDALFSFLAYEYCILLGSLYKIKSISERRKRRKLLREFEWLLQYTLNPKVRKVAYLNKFLGTRITEFILSQFMKSKQ